MSLLFNKKISLYIFITILVIIFQAYSPQIMLYQGINISLDVLLVFLTVLVLLNSTFFIILIAFLLGLLQDFIAHHQTMGLFSFIKSLTIFYLGKIKKNNNLWSKNYKYTYIYIIYVVHFLIFYSVATYDLNLMLFILSLLNAIATFLLFIIIEKILFNSKLI